MDKPPKNQSQPENANEATRDLASRIASAKRDRDLEDNRSAREDTGQMSGMARGMRIGTEFIAAILVGTGIGFLLDRFFGTKPWFLIIFMMLGMAAGFRNIYRLGMRPTVPPGSNDRGGPQQGH